MQNRILSLAQVLHRHRHSMCRTLHSSVEPLTGASGIGTEVFMKQQISWWRFLVLALLAESWIIGWVVIHLFGNP